MANVLGIDLGGKAVGLAIVQQPENQVLWCGTVHLSDRIKKLYDQRRVLRRARRSRVRYRKPKVQERGGGSGGRGTEGATYYYRRAKGLNQSLRSKCKHVDPKTGEVCGRNTPKRGNVRHLLIEDILTNYSPFATVDAALKQAIRDILASRQGTTRRQQRLKNVLSRIDAKADLKKQITDIIFGACEGRCEFCREHILSHHEQTQVPADPRWLPPSIRMKQEFLLKQIRQLAQGYRIDRVVIERARFDLQKIARGVIDDPGEYQQGHRYGFRNVRAALFQEFSGHCCYCGRSVIGKVWHVDHVYDPRRKTGAGRWDNLAIACDPCNHKKGGRTPEEAGMAFATIGEVVAGRHIRRSLRPKPLDGSRINKYMTQTDQGIRILKRELQELLGPVKIDETFGYVTSAWRDLWGLPKGRDTNEHHNDAIVVAANLTPEAPPKLDGEPHSVCQLIGGKRLYDQNPVSRRADGEYYQRQAVLAEEGGITPSQLPQVVDERRRTILAGAFDRYGVKPKKTLPPAALQRLPFKSVRLRKGDCTDANTRALPAANRRHRYKISNTGGTRVNEAIAVYETTGGRRAAYAVKNRRVFGRTPRPEDFARELWRFRPGDTVCGACGGVLGLVVKLGSNGTLTLDSGKSRVAHRCRKGHAQ
jgi:5-methylcytosine-specific restriction endonuclease McrA